MILKSPIIILNTEKNLYSPGDLVNILILINNFRSIIVNSLKICLLGVIKTNLNINNIIESNEVTVLFKEEMYYNFLNSCFLETNIDKKIMIGPCCKELNTNIKIPYIELPSTYKANDFKVEYNLVAVLDYINI